MARMILYGGEKDGHGQNGELSIEASDRPDVFYAVPNLDDEKIRLIKGTEAKRELHDKLAVLAYKFCPEASSADLFVMRREPALDKVAHS